MERQLATFAIKPPFDRRPKKYSITDKQLLEAAQRVREGNAYAALGGGLFKECIA